LQVFLQTLNTFIGVSSGYNSTTATNNVFIGENTGYQVKGEKNVIIRCNAVGFTNNNSNIATESVYIGYQSGFNSSIDAYTNNNTFIGTQTGYNNSSGSGNVYIGYQAGYNANSSNELYIDNSNTNFPLIYGDFANNSICINGNLGYSGTLGACSDKRYKKDVYNIPNALEYILNLNGVYYNWRTDEFPDMDFSETRQIGVIAQDVEIYFPELVSTDKNGYKMVDYSKFTPVLIEAVKEQQQIIENQENRINQLEEKVNELSEIISQIKE